MITKPCKSSKSIQGLSGVPGPVAKDLVKRFGTAHALQLGFVGFIGVELRRVL